MKTNKFLLAAIFASFQICVLAQSSSYKTLENRFVKQNLTAEDSAAFKTLGKQKAMSLFYQTELYTSNAGNSSNQAYVARQMPDLFYVPKGDTLQMALILEAAQKIQENKKGKPITFEVREAAGYLAKLECIDCKPKMSFLLVLMQTPKQFGKETENVWQVFLYDPTIGK